MMKEKLFSQGGKEIKCSECNQNLSLTQYCDHWKGEKLNKEEIIWVEKCRREKELGIHRTSNEKKGKEKTG